MQRSATSHCVSRPSQVSMEMCVSIRTKRNVDMVPDRILPAEQRRPKGIAMTNRPNSSCAAPIHPNSPFHVVIVVCCVFLFSYLAARLGGALVLRPEMIFLFGRVVHFWLQCYCSPGDPDMLSALWSWEILVELMRLLARSSIRRGHWKHRMTGEYRPVCFWICQAGIGHYPATTTRFSDNNFEAPEQTQFQTYPKPESRS
jgi:hypothetical protein